jgi:hypothetical protein
MSSNGTFELARRCQLTLNFCSEHKSGAPLGRSMLKRFNLDCPARRVPIPHIWEKKSVGKEVCLIVSVIFITPRRRLRFTDHFAHSYEPKLRPDL